MSPHIPRHAHRHECRCGDYLVCTQPPDRCVVPDPWLCPKHEFDAYDAFIDSLQPNPPSESYLTASLPPLDKDTGKKDF